MMSIESRNGQSSTLLFAPRTIFQNTNRPKKNEKNSSDMQTLRIYPIGSLYKFESKNIDDYWDPCVKKNDFI